jgi:hypothetical protein
VAGTGAEAGGQVCILFAVGEPALGHSGSVGLAIADWRC